MFIFYSQLMCRIFIYIVLSTFKWNLVQLFSYNLSTVICVLLNVILYWFCSLPYIFSCSCDRFGMMLVAQNSLITLSDFYWNEPDENRKIENSMFMFVAGGHLRRRKPSSWINPTILLENSTEDEEGRRQNKV